MLRDPLLYLDDILESIARIREYTSSMDYETFSRDTNTQDAVVRNLEIIREAAARLPENIKQAAYEIEWRKKVTLLRVRAGLFDF
jgi:uncharacterized protein with HEPN domain